MLSNLLEAIAKKLDEDAKKPPKEPCGKCGRTDYADIRGKCCDRCAFPDKAKAELLEVWANDLERIYDGDREPIPPEEGELPLGGMIYHGTHSREKFDMPRGPAWFTDSVEVASEFIRMDSTTRRVLAFEIIKPPQMLVFPIYQDVFSYLNERFGLDIDYTYDAADQVCELNHDGWILSHAYPGGLLEHDLEKGVVFTDTMLCNPEKFLRFAGEFEAEPEKF